MANKKSERAKGPLQIGKYEPMKRSVLPQKIDVLRHYLFLRTFIYSKIAELFLQII